MIKESAPAPWLPPKYAKADAAAIQALVRGDATPEQQQRAVNWVVNQAADTYGFTYRQDSRDHAFAEGRRFVGLQCVKMLKLNLSILKEV